MKRSWVETDHITLNTNFIFTTTCGQRGLLYPICWQELIFKTRWQLSISVTKQVSAGLVSISSTMKGCVQGCHFSDFPVRSRGFGLWSDGKNLIWRLTGNLTGNYSYLTIFAVFLVIFKDFVINLNIYLNDFISIAYNLE